MRGLSIIVASSGRPTLPRTVGSIIPQLQPGDELLVDVNRDSPWGHQARNRLMRQVRPGQGMLFMDDDDAYTPDGIGRIRTVFLADPDRIHIFQITGPDGTLFVWRDAALRVGNVSTQCFLVPQAAVGHAIWGDRYAGDFDFIQAAANAIGEPVFHRETIATLRISECPS